MWKPKRIVAMTVAIVVAGLMSFRISEEFLQRPESRLVLLVLLAASSIVIVAATARRSRGYIAHHPRALRIAGAVLGAISLIVFGVCLATGLVKRFGATTDEVALLAICSVFAGFLVYKLPDIAKPNKDLNDFIRSIRD